MELSGGILLAFCLLLVHGQQIAEEKCTEYRSLTKQKSSIVFLSVHSKVEHFENSKCANTVDLIVGGVDAKPGEFPHQALLGYIKKDDQENYDFSCGGTLISDRFVLTAAHCFKNGPPKIVRLGANNLANEFDNHADFTVLQHIRHPQYRGNSSYHDIALVKMASPVQFTKTIRPACMWTKSEINVSSVIATGFGLTEDSGDSSNIMQKVMLDIFTKTECAQFKNHKKFNRGIAEEQLCIGSNKGNKDTCKGDSGGPVQVLLDSKECVYHVLGVTSIGTACGIGKSSAIYTFVAPYIKWIEQIVWGQ